MKPKREPIIEARIIGHEEAASTRVPKPGCPGETISLAEMIAMVESGELPDDPSLAGDPPPATPDTPQS